LEGLIKRTSVCQKQVNPEWNEVFDLAVEDITSAVLNCEMWNKNPVKDDFMGCFSLPLSQLTRGLVVDDWCQLRNGEFVTGELHLSILATIFGQQPLAQILPVAIPRQVVAQEVLRPQVVEPIIVREEVIVKESVPVIRAVSVPCVSVPPTSSSRGYLLPINPAVPKAAVNPVVGVAPLPLTSATTVVVSAATKVPIF